MPLRTRCGTSRLPCMSLGVRAQGLGPRGGGTALAITICSVLPSVPYDAVGPPKFILLSRLNIQLPNEIKRVSHGFCIYLSCQAAADGCD